MKKLFILLILTALILPNMAMADGRNTESFDVTIANPNTIKEKEFIFELRPGETDEDYLVIVNQSDINLDFNLYGADGTLSQQGSFAVKIKTDPSENIGKWVKFKTPEITLKPGELKKLKFEVKIPEDTTLGEYTGGIATEKSKKDSNNPNVTIASRIIKKINVKVTDDPKPIPKKYTESIIKRPWYLYGSLVLFLISSSLLIWSHFHEKKKS